MPVSQLFRKKNINQILRDAHASENEPGSLRRTLKVRDLTALGIAAIVGAGIFSTIGNAAASGGPAVSLLFVFTAVTCGLSALCYAEFASRIPISGSAYTYAYASFGELIAWIIGWDLIIEYAIGNIAVAISWSDYFTALLSGIGLSLPPYLCIDFLSASNGFKEAIAAMKAGTLFSDLTPIIQDAYMAWKQAPSIAGVRIIADIPAFGIVAIISYLVYQGIQETKIASNIMVLVKISILLVIIGIGAFYVDPGNWSPFAPNGVGGVLKGVAAVFFAYIGFDAISTTAEECKNPQRDLPRSMILSLIITTILYVLISLVLTGLVNYKELAVGDPLAYVFERLDMTYLSGIIAISAVFAMASVLLVFQVGQPRIWMSMSRDGLLPPRFSKIHKKYKTPSFSTIITGLMVAIPALFLNLKEVTDLTSIGTLFAFILVSGGILILHGKNQNLPEMKKGYRIPYIDSRLFLPLIWVMLIILLSFIYRDEISQVYMGESGLNTLFAGDHNSIFSILLFISSSAIITYFAIARRYSLVPVLSLIMNIYLISQLEITNWLRFLVWLMIGIVIYFTYGFRNSKLGKQGINEKKK